MDLPDAIARIRLSTVNVAVGNVGAQGTRTLGAGFLVDAEKYVVTANHVVAKAVQDPALDELAVGIPLADVDDPVAGQVRAGWVHYPVELVATDEFNDLALLKMPPQNKDSDGVSGLIIGGRRFETPLASAKLRAARPRAGTAIATSGFPLGEESLVTSAGILASDFTREAEEPSPDRMLGDISVNTGNSGGPVYTIREAEIIGMCVRGRLAPALTATGPSSLHTLAGLCSIVPAAVIVKFLEANGVDPSPPPRRPSTKTGRSKNARKR